MGSSCRKVVKKTDDPQNARQTWASQNYNINVVDEKKGSKSQLKYQTKTNIRHTKISQQTAQRLKQSENKLIEKRQSRIDDDQEKLEQIKEKLEKLKAGKHEQVNITKSNSYFEMMKLQKQIQLYNKKIERAKNDKAGIESRRDRDEFGIHT